MRRRGSLPTRKGELMPSDGFDPEKVNLIARVLSDAWREIEGSAAPSINREAVQKKMARGLMVAVTSGELDPEKLKMIALSAAIED